MGIFSSTPDKDDKVTNLEQDAQERIRRIGTLRAQISQLTSEEKKLQEEYTEVKTRADALQKRSEELTRMKTEEETLKNDIIQREQKQAQLETELVEIQEKRRSLIPEIARLRSQVSNETSAAQKDQADVEKLGKIIAENVARKEKIMQDTTFMEQSSIELKSLEEKYKTIVEQIPLLRKKYEQTKQLVESLEADTDPVAKAIIGIWQQLPPDVLDKRLNLNRLNQQL